MKRSLFILLILLFPVAVYSQQVVPRLLQLKIKEGDEAKVRASRLSVPSDSTVNVGIQRLDVLNQQFGVSKMQRVFPYAGEYEEKHRKYGLHLWYELVLDGDVDPVLAAEFYKATGVVEDAEPVYRVVRIGGMVPDRQDTVALTNYQAMPSSKISRSAVSNDPSLARQWHYNNNGAISGSVAGVDIGLFEAWDITTGSSDVIVAVIDGGVDYTHEDLAANMWVNTGEVPGNNNDNDGNGYKNDVYGYDFYGDSGNILADGHGTHVAGTIAAVNNNGKGVAGIAGGSGGGNGVCIMSLQIFQANGVGAATNLNIKRAFIYAADHGAVIAQNSWGYDSPNVQNSTDLEAIRYFIKEAGTDEDGTPRPNTPMVGGIAIFSAGNNAQYAGYDPKDKYYPQAYKEVVAVAAIGPDGKRAKYSGYGDWIDITAPGGHYPAAQNQQVYSTFPGNMYGYDAGTSMACPHVSGVAALVLSKHGHNGYTPDSLRNRLLVSARSLEELEPDYASQMGAGLLDAYRALSWVHIDSATINPSSIGILDGQTVRLTLDIQPASASSKEVIWESSNPECVSVDDSGNITGFFEKGSSATITARTIDGNHEAACAVTVYKESVSISQNWLKLLEGQRHQLTATIVPTNIANRQILWSSSNPTCVSVDSNGNVEVLCKGGESAVIAASSNDGSIAAYCNVTIYADIVVPEGFSPNNDGINDLFRILLPENEKYTLRIFDKSGQLYYESPDYQNSWDGIANKGAIKGEKVPVGTYYYVLTNNRGQAKKGYVVIKY